MKKLLALVMSLCLLCACCAYAEETVEINWSDVEAGLADSGVTGEFVTFDEIAVKIWIPEGLPAVELTDEDREAGYIGYFANEEAQMAVMYVNTNGASLDEYAQYLSSESDVTEIEKGTVNNFPCVSYKLPAQDSVCIAFTTEAGYILEVTCAPLSVENAELVWGAVIASIQSAE